MEFRDKEYDVFRMFDKQWALATAGTLDDYDDIYEQTIVEVVPLGHADKGAETMADETGMVRLELVEDAESVQK